MTFPRTALRFAAAAAVGLLPACSDGETAPRRSHPRHVHGPGGQRRGYCAIYARRGDRRSPFASNFSTRRRTTSTTSRVSTSPGSPSSRPRSRPSRASRATTPVHRDRRHRGRRHAAGQLRARRAGRRDQLHPGGGDGAGGALAGAGRRGTFLARTLPSWREAPALTLPRRRSCPTAARTGIILVVDDQESVRAMLRRRVERRRAHGARSGRRRGGTPPRAPAERRGGSHPQRRRDAADERHRARDDHRGRVSGHPGDPHVGLRAGGRGPGRARR